MNIAFHQIEQNKEMSGIRGDHDNGYGGGIKNVKDSNIVSGGFRWDRSSSVVGNQAYRDQKDKTTELLDSASSYDAKNSKNFMVVMSNTLSDEDYKKLMEDGSNPGDYEPEEMVTIIDEIKVTLAQAGVHIAGYTDNLDTDAVREAVGSDGYAVAIARALESKNLPVTEKNVRDCYNEIEKAAHLTELSDGAKKYLLENELEPTIDSLYKAAYAGAKDASAQPSGYFGTGAEGYLAKKGNPEEFSAMEDQIQKIISEAGLEVGEETMSDARWLLEKGLPLTGENLFRLQEINQLSFPIGAEEAALAAADALSVGLSAKEADLTVGNGYKEPDSGYIRRAQEINEKTQALTDENLAGVIKEGKSLTLFWLFGTENAGTETVSMETERDSKWIAAKKQLLEVQLHMSAQANLKLMKQGIHIELEPLDQLLKLLEREESIYHASELADISEKAEEIKSMPAATIGISVQEAWMAKGVFTLDRVYETGSSLAQTYAKAGESYEALMTSPRADLGDSIKTAFRNVDALLEESNMEITDDNRRAVRILGYNQMEITEENMDAVKEADAMLNRVLAGLTPEKTLRMIREGVNPMEMNLDELAGYLTADTEGAADIEKYSRYLYRLEQNHEITAEEKEAYIGIYRLLRQIEKGDGAAIGTVVSNKQELNLENLLSAVRTRKKGYVDAKIDDAFGLLSDMEKKGTSISDQILNYYQQKAGKLADDLSGSQEGMEQSAVDHEIESFRRMGTVSEEHFHALLADDIPLTANNLLAEEALVSQGNLFENLAKIMKGGEREKNFVQKAEKIKEAMSEGEEAVKEAYADMTETAEETVKSDAGESGSYIDVRSMAVYARQITLLNRHAEKENYYVPVQFNQEWTMLHVQIVNGNGQGKVSVDYKGNAQGEGKAGATFVVKEDHIEGLIGVSADTDVEKYTEIAGKCAESILAETGKKADITCVQSETMNLEAFMATDSKEKQASTKMLYQVAKAFIHTMEQEVTKNESQL
ncbi:MAG: DUF6240 domain-containing protein [Lachnospiraceae bacterium]